MKDRFYFLDILRGLAALSVVFYHWRNFFFKDIIDGKIDASGFPLYSVFGFFYDNGNIAVYLFFLLSGFIFFYLYQEKIKTKTISFWKFLILRISRLYPLHILTLFLVLILQQIYYSKNQGYFAYYANDAYHFFLNIFLASNWGFQEGFSFNYPIWSVSTEMLLYLIFFIVCFTLSARFFTLLLISAFGLIFMTVYLPTGIGIFFFFIGGIICVIYTKIMNIDFNKISEINIKNIILNFSISKALKISIAMFILVFFTIFNNVYIKYGIIFGSVIFTLVLIEKKYKFGENLLKTGNFFNSISYSSYLIHFPLQLIFINIIGDNSFFYTNSSLLIFFTILILLSMISFKFFEVPLQKFIRNKLL